MDRLPDDIADILVDRYEGWELVEYLNIGTAEIISAFEDLILDHLADIKEELRYGEDEDEQPRDRR